MGSDAGHERVVVKYTRQVVVNLGTVSGNLSRFPAHDSGNPCLAVAYFLIQITILVELVASLSAHLVSDVEVVVAFAQITILSSIHRALVGRFHHCVQDGERRFVLHILQHQGSAALPRIVDVTGTVGLPVIEVGIVRSRQPDGGTVLPVLIAIKVDGRFADNFDRTVLWYFYRLEYSYAL